MDRILCKTCADKCPEEMIDGEEIDDGQFLECSICGSPDASDGRRVESIVLPNDFVTELGSKILACEQRDCGGGHYDSEDDRMVGGETNSYLWELLSEIAQGRDDEVLFQLVLSIAESRDELAKMVELPEFRCPNCGCEIDDWYAEVKVRRVHSLIARLANPPAEIRTIQYADPASRIEWWRTDCSTYLVHLTRTQRLATKRDNVEYEDTTEMVPAPEVLWSILMGRRLYAKKGKGMSTKAVCFTEKPLGALKDTIIGREAGVRKRSRSLVWAPYGVMFDKHYLQTLGVAPVLHLSDEERAQCPPNLVHRTVPFRTGANWMHEREWRAPDDIEFDLAHCIVLVPNFEQAEIFRGALEKMGRRARGFLPLHDLFAAL